MKKKKIRQEKNLVLLDCLTQKEKSIISGGGKKVLDIHRTISLQQYEVNTNSSMRIDNKCHEALLVS